MYSLFEDKRVSGEMTLAPYDVQVWELPE